VIYLVAKIQHFVIEKKSCKQHGQGIFWEIFKRRKLKFLPKSFKILDEVVTFFLKMGGSRF
jgi:hypothetical protein